MTPEELKKARQQLGMTQAEFAKAISWGSDKPVCTMTVSNWERGVHAVPSLMRLAIIALRKRKKEATNEQE